MGTSHGPVGAGVAFGGAGTADLGFLLSATVTAPDAAADPVAGPLVGAIVAELAARGADDPIRAHLVPGVVAADLELRTYQVGFREPVSRRQAVAGWEVVMVMLERGEARVGQELVTFGAGGAEASVLVRMGEGPLVYQFPSAPRAAPVVPEPPPSVADLVEAVRSALAETTIEVDLGGIEEVVARAVAQAGRGERVSPRLEVVRPAPAELSRPDPRRARASLAPPSSGKGRGRGRRAREGKRADRGSAGEGVHGPPPLPVVPVDIDIDER